MIKVMVKKDMPDGFYAFHVDTNGVGTRKRPGDVFHIKNEKGFSTRYMDCIDDAYMVEDGELVPKRKKPGPKPKVEEGP